MDTKVCKRCGKVKKLESFYRNKNYPDGRTIYCKICQSEATKKSYEKTKDHLKVFPLRLTNTYLEDYCKMWDFLTQCGYDVQGDIHEQFCEKYNLTKRKKRKSKDENRFTIDQCIKKDPLN